MVSLDPYECPFCGQIVYLKNFKCPECSYHVKKHWVCDHCGDIKSDHDEKRENIFGEILCSDCDIELLRNDD